MTNAFAEQMEQARDLRLELTGLERGDEKEFLFQEWSPGRTMVKLWSLIDGEEITIPKYMVGPALMKRQRGGGYVFTSDPAKAPAFREGHVRCFLAEGSSERDSGLLEAAGLDHLPACPAIHLRSAYSKRIHGDNRHPQSSGALKEYLALKERTEDREDRRRQLEATLALAGRVAGESDDVASGPRRGRPPRS
mgnify:CR=1 FL=1